jgi:hypothetical protein
MATGAMAGASAMMVSGSGSRDAAAGCGVSTTGSGILGAGIVLRSVDQIWAAESRALALEQSGAAVGCTGSDRVGASRVADVPIVLGFLNHMIRR